MFSFGKLVGKHFRILQLCVNMLVLKFLLTVVSNKLIEFNVYKVLGKVVIQNSSAVANMVI